jgi:hypothetical protein
MQFKLKCTFLITLCNDKHLNYKRLQPESESYVTTDGQSASLSWNKAPFWSLRPDLYCLTVAGLLIWGALSDERTGLSFAIATGPRQRSHFLVRPYFTVSDSRLPFSSPPLTRRVTVEVFDPASTRGFVETIAYIILCNLTTFSVSRLHSVDDWMINEYGGFAGMKMCRGKRNTRRKFAQMPLCPP